MPFVSVIVPVFNGDRFIQETIDSVLRQSYSDFELIVVNDGSSDDTVHILNSFSDSRIKIIHIENQGVSQARNVGFGNSSGQYISFLDADDLWADGRLRETVEYLNTQLSVGLVHTNMVVIDEGGMETGEVNEGIEGFVLEDLLSWNGCVIPAPSSVLIRRDVLEEIGLFDTNLSTAADQDIFIRIAHRYKIGKVDKPLGKYRIHGGNMHLNIERMEQEHIYTFQKSNQSGFFVNEKFKEKCFSNLYLILAGSYWSHTSKFHKVVQLVLISLRYDWKNGLYKLLSKLR